MVKGDILIVKKSNKENKGKGDFEVERQNSKCQNIQKHPEKGFYKPHNSNFKFPKRSQAVILRKSLDNHFLHLMAPVRETVMMRACFSKGNALKTVHNGSIRLNLLLQPSKITLRKAKKHLIIYK